MQQNSFFSVTDNCQKDSKKEKTKEIISIKKANLRKRNASRTRYGIIEGK